MWHHRLVQLLKWRNKLCTAKNNDGSDEASIFLIITIHLSRDEWKEEYWRDWIARRNISWIALWFRCISCICSLSFVSLFSLFFFSHFNRKWVVINFRKIILRLDDLFICWHIKLKQDARERSDSIFYFSCKHTKMSLRLLLYVIYVRNMSLTRLLNA